MLVNLSEVQHALESEALVPCFQPIMELRTGRLAGFEVLARWKHPDLGLILPENLISLAEQNGLIGQLTNRILSKSFLAAQALSEPLFLAVNISPIQLHYLSLPRQIRDLAEDHGFPLQRLTVEITESALVNNLDRAQKIAIELREMGCSLALDDFGTGYSSLTHLQALPFSKLKIDRSFVKSMTEKRESRKIVAAVVGLGHSLDMITVAEGVETKEQADILLWLGCELGQGWLYGRPLPAEHIPSMIAASPLTLSTQSLASGGGSLRVSGLEALPAQRSAQLQAIYDGAPVGLCFLDKNLRYVSINQRLADLNGAPVAAHIGRTVREMVPKLFPRVLPFLQRALQGEVIVNLEVLKPSPKPGEPDLTVHSSYQPAFDEAHEVIGVSVAIMDVTRSKRTEDMLRETEEDRRCMLELSPQIPWTFDADGNLRDISSRWVQITGMSSEQARNLGWLEALHPEERAPAMEALKQALETGRPIDIVHRVKTVNGNWKWLRARGSRATGHPARSYAGTADAKTSTTLRSWKRPCTRGVQELPLRSPDVRSRGPQVISVI
jgi:PAS domain S-box-containing protein